MVESKPGTPIKDFNIANKVIIPENEIENYFSDTDEDLSETSSATTDNKEKSLDSDNESSKVSFSFETLPVTHFRMNKTLQDARLVQLQNLVVRL
jgi:hypothetical protein